MSQSPVTRMGITTLLLQQWRFSAQPLLVRTLRRPEAQLRLKSVLLSSHQSFRSVLSFSSKPQSLTIKAIRNASQCRATPRLSKKSDRCGTLFGCIGTPYKFLTFGLLPFSLFRRKDQSNTHELSPEILSHIPKQVFQKDVLVKKKGNALTRFLWKLWEYLRLVVRFTRILFTFGPLLAVYPVTYISESATHMWWNALLKACEWSGPTFIKLGQWASTRRDLFSAEFCDLFTKLHSSTRRHSWFTTKRKLRKAFGKRWREIFIKIDRKPIGSGCIAQVCTKFSFKIFDPSNVGIYKTNDFIVSSFFLFLPLQCFQLVYQVHKAYMAADMIPDESLVEDFMDDSEDEPEVDFSEGIT